MSEHSAEVGRRECGWLGCGDHRCEPYCAGVQTSVTSPATQREQP